MRTITSAALGALAVVVGWGAWSMLSQGDPEALAVPGDKTVGTAPVRPSAPLQDAMPKLVARVSDTPAAASSTVPTSPRTPGEAVVMEHGMPMAIHASVGDGARPAPPPTVALPAGVAPADALVNHAGMVALTRNRAGVTAGGVSLAQTPPPRLAAVSRAQ